MTDKSGRIERSQLNSAIDYASLKLELENALSADRLYRLRNDAKLRAVDQNVPTYDGFKQMVDAAHLRPLHRDDYLFRRANEVSFWNPIAAKDRPEPEINRNSIVPNQGERNERTDVEQMKNTDIVTCEQFTRAWKGIRGHAAKFRYLESSKYDKHVSNDASFQKHPTRVQSFRPFFFFSRDLFVQKIFRREIPSPLFAELIDVCSEVAAIKDNVENIVKILSVMSRCNRFSLTISFMEGKEKATCTRLFDRLVEQSKHRNPLLVDAIESLRITYGLRSRQTESSV
ncbi:dynein axonemal assembly factor 19 [Lasioglossum baleicum]|uniref:dynein axonemal assembly factor 19 n=1 Tax=Lasioglossum baleicum TaxID=434251 RepID=UPI003FCD4707